MDDSSSDISTTASSSDDIASSKRRKDSSKAASNNATAKNRAHARTTVTTTSTNDDNDDNEDMMMGRKRGLMSRAKAKALQEDIGSSKARTRKTAKSATKTSSSRNSDDEMDDALDMLNTGPYGKTPINMIDLLKVLDAKREEIAAKRSVLSSNLDDDIPSSSSSTPSTPERADVVSGSDSESLNTSSNDDIRSDHSSSEDHAMNKDSSNDNDIASDSETTMDDTLDNIGPNYGVYQSPRVKSSSGYEVAGGSDPSTTSSLHDIKNDNDSDYDSSSSNDIDKGKSNSDSEEWIDEENDPMKEIVGRLRGNVSVDRAMLVVREVTISTNSTML
jgi:hypothetical protein